MSDCVTALGTVCKLVRGSVDSGRLEYSGKASAGGTVRVSTHYHDDGRVSWTVTAQQTLSLSVTGRGYVGSFRFDYTGVAATLEGAEVEAVAQRRALEARLAEYER